MTSEICLKFNPGFLRIVAWHVLAWLLFIGYEIGYILSSNTLIGPLWVYTVFYTISIIYFYTFSALLLRMADSGRTKYLRIILLLAFLFIGGCALRLLADYILVGKANFRLFSRRYLSATISRNVYFSLLSIFYWAASSVNRARAERAEAEQKRLTTENQFATARNAYLRQQLSPHLLFNSLNFIYSRVFRQSAEAGDSVMLLSDIMRYSLDEGGPDGKVPLSGELEQIHHLVAINRSRYEEPIQFDLHISGDPDSLRIIPLVLFTLTENIFKHGDLETGAQPASVAIVIENSGQLTLKSINQKKAFQHGRTRSGTGLQNLRTRLDYAYPGRHELIINEDESLFELNLALQL